MSELFPTETVTLKSPKLLWMERHGLTVQPAFHDPTQFVASTHWAAAGIPDPDFSFGDGATQDEAIAEWAKEVGVRLWNEEAPNGAHSLDRMVRWIPVANEAPKGDEVIYWDGEDVSTFFPNTGDEPDSQVVARCQRFGITHWMPFPKPPDEKPTEKTT